MARLRDQGGRTVLVVPSGDSHCMVIKGNMLPRELEMKREIIMYRRALFGSLAGDVVAITQPAKTSTSDGFENLNRQTEPVRQQRR